MVQYYGVSIPEELISYHNKLVESMDSTSLSNLLQVDNKKRLEADENVVSYYNYDGELEKQIFYTNSSITCKKYYKNNRIYIVENYENDRLCRTHRYLKDGNTACILDYKYNSKHKVESLSKYDGKNHIDALFAYDEFERLVSREIIYNNELLLLQKYRYDILDRIIEYIDKNQHIVVNSMTTDNKLISYKITDKMNNIIEIKNVFNASQYVESIITLNGHSVVLQNQSYVNNVMLKKPYATEDDLDIIIANLLNSKRITPRATSRTDYNGILDNNMSQIIDSNIQNLALPISMRKLLLYNMAIKNKQQKQ